MIDRTEVETLEMIRAQLAHRLIAGEPVEDELDRVEDRLSKLAREGERRALAADEEKRLADVAAAEERAAEAARQEATVRAALSSQRLAAGEIEQATARLVGALAAYLECGQAAYTASGGRRRRVLGAEQAATYLTWRLSDLLPGHFTRPAHQLRKPLTEALGDVEATL